MNVSQLQNVLQSTNQDKTTAQREVSNTLTNWYIGSMYIHCMLVCIIIHVCTCNSRCHVLLYECLFVYQFLFLFRYFSMFTLCFNLVIHVYSYIRIYVYTYTSAVHIHCTYIYIYHMYVRHTNVKNMRVYNYISVFVKYIMH